MAVPAVVGMKQDEGARRLDERGLVPEIAPKVSKFPSGTVLAQDPGGGTEVARHSHVALSVAAVLLAVSRGPNPILTVVPDVIGKTQQSAASTLQNAGFNVQVLTVKPSTPGQTGKVVDEQPAGSTRAPEGSTLTIYVGSG